MYYIFPVALSFSFAPISLKCLSWEWISTLSSLAIWLSYRTIFQILLFRFRYKGMLLYSAQLYNYHQKLITESPVQMASLYFHGQLEIFILLTHLFLRFDSIYVRSKFLAYILQLDNSHMAHQELAAF